MTVNTNSVRLRAYRLAYVLVALAILVLAGCALHQDASNTKRDVLRDKVVHKPVNIEAYLAPVITPIAVDWPPVVRPLHELAVVQETQSEVHCMAQVMYREARGEGVEGMTAVGYTVLNRIASGDFRSSTICGIVRASNTRSDGTRVCQFSWVCTPLNNAPMRGESATKAYALARAVIRREVPNPVDNSTFFNTKNMRPRHTLALTLIAVIGNHAFYGKPAQEM